jgi:hypothetical protein
MLDISITSLHPPRSFLSLIGIGEGAKYFRILSLILGCHERTKRKDPQKGRGVS